MEISLLNSNFHTLVSSETVGNSICSDIHKAPGVREVCKASDIEHLVAVTQKREGSLYVCPFGINEAIVPVTRDERIVGYLIATIGGSEVSGERAMAAFNILKVLAAQIADEILIADNEESIGVLVKRYVKGNLDKKITLSEIARSLHCSTVTLTEHFRSEFGITIMEYVRRKRMEEARRLLLATDAPLREIALMLGYPDVEYFSRSFKSEFGQPPAAWRKDKRDK
jgi:AraC-like DNA-binding protein